VSLATVRRKIVQTDWAPARIASLRCGDWRNNLRYPRCSSAQVEEAARAALELAGQALNLLRAILLAMLIGLIRKSKVSDGLRDVLYVELTW
jgi:hypothetical protein